MSILNAFDPDSKPLFTPEQLYGTGEQIAEVCIVSFHHKVLERVLAEYHPAAAARAFTANGPVELYLLELGGRPTLFYMSPIGAPAAGAIGNEFVKMIFVSFLNSNIYPLKNLLTSRVCISLETLYSTASSHFPTVSHLQ